MVHLALRRAHESGLDVVCFAFPGGYGTWHCAGFAESRGIRVHYFCPEADVDTPYGDYLRRIGREPTDVEALVSPCDGWTPTLGEGKVESP